MASPENPNSIDPQVRIGHFHLKIADLDRSRVLLRRPRLRVDTGLWQSGGVRLGGRLSPPHRAEHLGELGREAVHHVNQVAFGGDAEANLVDALCDGGFAEVSLVAEVDGVIMATSSSAGCPSLQTLERWMPCRSHRWRSCRVICDEGSAAGLWKRDWKPARRRPQGRLGSGSP
jgi:hypothetical protein